MAKRTIVCGQLIHIPCYGCEAFDGPNEGMRRLVRAWSRWVIGAWQGSNAQKVQALSGIDNLDEWFRKRKIRWAASMYGRHLPEMRLVAEKILQQRYEEHNVQFRWMKRQLDMAEQKPFTIRESNLEVVEEYFDVSRLDGAAAAAISRLAECSGMHAMVTDTEMVGVLLALEDGSRWITLDSQGAIQKLKQLYTQPARLWIEEQLQLANREGCAVMWVKGHAGVEGNEVADRRAKFRAYG